MVHEIKVGHTYFLEGGYDGLFEVVVSAVGLQNVMYCPVPFVVFNGELSEHTLRIDKFKQKARASKVVPA